MLKVILVSVFSVLVIVNTYFAFTKGGELFWLGFTASFLLFAFEMLESYKHLLLLKLKFPHPLVFFLKYGLLIVLLVFPLLLISWTVAEYGYSEYRHVAWIAYIILGLGFLVYSLSVPIRVVYFNPKNLIKDK